MGGSSEGARDTLRSAMRLAAIVVPLAVLFAAAPARADIPPPDDYVEPCTLEQQQRAGIECVACASTFASMDKCQTELAPLGFAHACSTYGASVWTEVWCRPQGSAAVPVRGPVAATGCSRAGDHPGGVVTALGLVGLAGAWAMRRRRRDRRIVGTRELDAAGRSGAC